MLIELKKGHITFARILMEQAANPQAARRMVIDQLILAQSEPHHIDFVDVVTPPGHIVEFYAYETIGVAIGAMTPRALNTVDFS